MTDHTHTERVPGCYRCELGADEAESAMLFEIEDLEADVAALTSALRLLRQDYQSKVIAFESRIRGIDEVLGKHGEPYTPVRVSELQGIMEGGPDSVEFVREQRDRASSDG